MRPGDDQNGEYLVIAGVEAPFGPDLLFEALDVPGLVVHVEICEDYWVPIPPSSEAALAGATVLANLSGSPITIARADDRKLLSQSQSFRCLAAYVYAAAGMGESTNDLSWDGQTMIYEAGQLLAETERFPDGPRRSVADVDLDRLRQDRLRQGTFDDNRRTHAARTTASARCTSSSTRPPRDIGLRRPLDRFPFVPDDPARLAQDCYEAFNIQVSGLVQRMEAIGRSKPVLGVSGGLDSTHALLVIARAMDRMGRPRSDILTYTMPGFATSDHTKSNAIALAEADRRVDRDDRHPGCRASSCSTKIKHPFADGEPVHDITFENVQAGLRTDYLFRLANQNGGMVIGTSDLSELALGWTTYGVGDQMSHYAVNTGVPKTLIQHVIRWVIAARARGRTTALDRGGGGAAVRARHRDQPRTGARRSGRQGAVDRGHDRALRPARLHALPHPALRVPPVEDRLPRLARLGRQGCRGLAARIPGGRPLRLRPADDRTWMRVFLKRYFAFAQFKRSAIPNGPKVSPAGSLSPRGTGARRRTATRARGSPSWMPRCRRGS